jgi:hypothetical protein
MLMRLPERLLSRLLLPTLGRPTIAMKGMDGINDSQKTGLCAFDAPASSSVND